MNNEEKEFSEDYPLGGMCEPYDIEREKELIEQDELEQGCIECGEKEKPIIKQCSICGGAIRACCPDHENKC